MDLKNFYKGKKILVTGGVGTVGLELVRQLLSCGVSVVRVFDNSERRMFEFLEHYKNDSRIRGFLGDVRDKDRILRAMEDVNIVFHAAALKHVEICEYNPFEAVQTNILGVQNIIDSSLKVPTVERVVFTSSDKAVNPSNVMGTSKLMGERLITAANDIKGRRNIIFSSTRFGNVLGSSGSVVPLFKEQVMNGGPVTVTSSKMTRFIMSLEESVYLVLKSAFLAKGGEIFVHKMPVMSITTLAKVIIKAVSKDRMSDIEIKEIGIKAGEKLYEELITEEESSRTIELEDMFVIKPSAWGFASKINYDVYGGVKGNYFGKQYRSCDQPQLSEKELESYLRDCNLI